MQPHDLVAGSFDTYPPEAKSFAKQNLTVLQQLPLPLAIIMLREVIGYDWKFPAERQLLNQQFAWLQSLSNGDRALLLASFSGLSLTSALSADDWVARPQQASEDVTAYLWSTHQVDAFHTAASTYAEAWHKAVPAIAPATPRLCVVALGAELNASGYQLFRKLRPHGILYTNVSSNDAAQAISQAIERRAKVDPTPYQHWLVTDQLAAQRNNAVISQVSWKETEALRTAILQRMQKVINSPSGGPEQLRTMLAATSPADLGLSQGKDERLDRFKINVFTEGSGTQLFCTTFTQWTAREILRRAQPSTLVVRYGVRQRQLPMDELVEGASESIPDPTGSLVDADIGAFYTWINQQRLPGSQESRFIAWSEAFSLAVVVAPGLDAGTVNTERVYLSNLLAI